MISISFFRAGGNITLKMSGHAGYSMGGADIVCAAVSGIFYALLGYLANEEEGLEVKKIASGDVEISCPERYASAMRLAYIGFLQIALTYKGTVTVSETVWHGRVAEPIRTAI